MKKYILLWLFDFVLLLIASGFLYEAKGQDVEGIWNGKVSFNQKFSGLTGNSERDIDVTITENRVTGSHTYFGKLKIGDNYLGETNCNVGDSVGELHAVIINEFDSTYRIEIISPSCTGTSVSALDGSITPYGPDQKDIIITDKRLDANHNILSGTETTISDVMGSGKLTTTITWSLVRSIDVVLIVTPQKNLLPNYDNWLPVPGKDELTKGSVMNISLKVQRKNGQPSALKAESFELKLSNTSKEPGITLNAPLSPSPDQLPDLRLLPLSIAESKEEDQFITIPCTDGSTGKVFIGSYDGGGWTTLTAEAILEDGTHIKGHLLVSAGETEIPIPKRNPGTKIASSWLAANGNPGEMDDKELDAALKAAGNNHPGDGLTAYEEYRGVISQGKFKRLDPKKEELGVAMKRTEIPLFAQGLRWFETATNITPIRFLNTEIDADRRINKNATSAHIYDQFVLRLAKRNLPTNTIGFAAGTGGPSTTTEVGIDWGQMQHLYPLIVAGARPDRVLYSLTDMLAITVAHELSHGMNVEHHGGKSIETDPQEAPRGDPYPPYRIFNTRGITITIRPYPLEGIGTVGTLQSGDISCVMIYNPYYHWAFTIGDDNANIFNEVPQLPMSPHMCNSNSGTGINATIIYFGNARIGNCLSHINLKL